MSKDNHCSQCKSPNVVKLPTPLCYPPSPTRPKVENPMQRHQSQPPHHVDLGFLDDFNIDEIVKSLNDRVNNETSIQGALVVTDTTEESFQSSENKITVSCSENKLTINNNDKKSDTIEFDTKISNITLNRNHEENELNNKMINNILNTDNNNDRIHGTNKAGSVDCNLQSDSIKVEKTLLKSTSTETQIIENDKMRDSKDETVLENVDKNESIEMNNKNCQDTKELLSNKPIITKIDNSNESKDNSINFTHNDTTNIENPATEIIKHEDLAAISQSTQEVLDSRAGVPPHRAPLKTPVGLLTRLPNLDLPHFDGRLDTWMGFIGLFESVVDSREDLSPSQKLAYLLSVLDGETKGLVQHLPIRDGSYEVARSLLNIRYHNHCCLADTYIDQIIDLPVVSNSAQLRTELLNPLLIATNALNRLGLPVTQWSYLLVRIVLKRLPVSLRTHFEQEHARDEASPLPTIEQLLTFLENECRMGDVMVADTPVRPSEPGPTNQRRTAQIAPKGKAPRFAVAQVARQDCRYCKSSQRHPTAKCPSFAVLHVAARRQIAKTRNWCFSCLGNHFQRECPDTHPCPNCGGQHLNLLCKKANGRRDRAESPPVVYHDYREARPERLPSPPLAKRPRLKSRNPRYGRS